MKRIVCICVMCLACFNLIAQRSIDDGVSKKSKGKSLPAMFQQALDNGISREGFYQFVNSSGKIVSENDFNTYCRNNDYIVKSVNTTQVSRFGDIEASVSNALFVPSSQLSYYVFNQMKKTNTPLSSLSRKGKCYTYHTSKKTSQIFYPWEVNWSGEVVDGLLQGSGEGFGYRQNDMAVYFKGTFNHGLPEGETTFYYVWWSPDKNIVVDGFNSKKECTCQTGTYSEGLLSIKGQSGKYGFVDETGKMCIEPQFNSVIKPFINGQAIVSRRDTSEMYINKYAKVLGVTETYLKSKEEERLALEARRQEHEQKLKEAELKRKKEAAEREKQDIERRKQIYPTLKNKFHVGDVYRNTTTTSKKRNILGIPEWYDETERIEGMIAEVRLNEEDYSIECILIVIDYQYYSTDAFGSPKKRYEKGQRISVWPTSQGWNQWEKVN